MGTSKKDKDPSRAERKAKKRKLEDAIPDLPGDISAPEEQNGNSKGSKKRRHSEPTEKEDVDKLEEKVAKKVKKEKDRKKEKDKEADEIQALNGDSQAQSKGGDDDSKQEKKDKKAKKAKKLKDAEDDATAGGSENDKLNDGPLPGSDEQPRKSKKERKAEKKAAEAAQKSEDQGKFKSQAASGEVENVEGESQTDSTKAKKNNRNRDKKRKAAASVEETSEGKAARFIVFIGKLHDVFPSIPLICRKPRITHPITSFQLISTPRQSTLHRNHRVNREALRGCPPKIHPALDEERRPVQVARVRVCGVRGI